MIATPRILRFRAAGLPLAVLVADVFRLDQTTTALPIPFGHRALVGVVTGDNAIEPIFPLFDLRGLCKSPVAQQAYRYLLVDTSAGLLGIVADSVGRATTSYQRQEEDFTSVPPALRCILAGCGSDDSGGFFFFSPGQLANALELCRK